MTILNVWVSPERAIVAVDTLASRPGTLEPMEASKAMPIPHVNAIVAGFGNLALMQAVHWQLTNCDHPGFDSMAVTLPNIIDQCFDKCRADALSYGLSDADLSAYHCIALVGWSQSLGEMSGQYHVRHPGESRFREREAIDDSITHPNVAETDAPDHDLSTTDGMEAQARYQVAWGRLTYPKLAIGGRLILAELKRDSMTITSRALD